VQVGSHRAEAGRVEDTLTVGPQFATRRTALLRFLKPLSRLRTGLWLIPLTCVLGGVALSFGTIAIDRQFNYELVPKAISGRADAAIEILGTVAASMVSLAALVLTITMVVVQLAMGQFSPRIVQRILQDKPSQLATETQAASVNTWLVWNGAQV
jgi:uncharacterized membrane protein